MAYKYTNRRGDVYYFQTHERNGKIGYSASTKPTGKPLDHPPEGYEIYERPDNAQVFIRKIKPTHILPSERQLVEDSIRRLTRLQYFIVEVLTDSLVIYTSGAESDASLNLMRTIAPMTTLEAHSIKRVMIDRGRYEKMMRFTLIDAQKRRFSVERWCFRGSVDDWHFLAGGNTLNELMEAYIPHLGGESFFELM